MNECFICERIYSPQEALKLGVDLIHAETVCSPECQEILRIELAQGAVIAKSKGLIDEDGNATLSNNDSNREKIKSVLNTYGIKLPKD